MCLFLILTPFTNAKAIVVKDCVDILPDGSYYTIEIISSKSRSSIKTGTKTTKYYSVDNKLLWQVSYLLGKSLIKHPLKAKIKQLVLLQLKHIMTVPL